MDEELVALLARLDDEANPLSDEELAELQSQITARTADIDPANASDDDIAVLTEARDALVRIREVATARETAAGERAAAAQALLDEIAPAEPTAEELAAQEAAAAEAAAAEQAEQEAAAAAAAAEAAGGAAPEATAETPPAGDQPAPESIAAGGAPPAPERTRPSISRLAHRTPRSHRPQAPASTLAGATRSVLTAAGDLQGISPGDEVDVEQWAEACRRKIDALSKIKSSEGDGTFVPFGTIRREFPAERFLTDNEADNEEKINAVTSPAAMREAGRALAASGVMVSSGGVCSPVAVDYSVVSISQASRPGRDALVNFGASRGGLRYILPHTLAQVTADGPAALWTEANDVALNNPATKPHAVFACQGVQEALVDAVTSITQFGNFQSRYFPEQIAQYLEEVDAVHARLAEATILAAMTTGSTAVSGGLDVLGATSEVLGIVERAAEATRYRNRMDPEAPLRLLYPEWLEGMIRTDLARRLPGDSGGQSERLAVADAEIDRWFAVRNINVTNVQDSPTGASTFQGFLAQGAGLLNPWPSHVIMWLYPEGSWMFLDGGELNLGMVRDSTLNRTNDYQMFSETFEKAIFRGHESLVINLEVCPSGKTAATADSSTLCTSGS